MIKILEKRKDNKYLMVEIDIDGNPMGKPFEGTIPSFKVEVPTRESVFKGREENFFIPETLDKRFELRVTTLEKQIIDELKKKGVNISEILREKLLEIDSEITKKVTRERIDKARKLYTIIYQEYSKTLEERNEIVYHRGQTQNEAQAITNYRWKLDYVLDSYEKQINILNKFFEKYKIFFEEEWKAESTDR